MDSARVRQVYMAAHEGVAGWDIAIRLTAHDDEGNLDEGSTIRLMASIPDFDDDAWQLLAILDTAIRAVMEEEGIRVPLRTLRNP